MAATTKIQEGLAEIKEAEKCLKTSFLKWNPDYASAANHYDKAALCFKIAKSYAQAKDTYIKASEAHSKNNSLFHSAKALTLAAGISSDLSDIDGAVELMRKACLIFQQQGSLETATSALIKAAKFCEPTHLHTAVELYKEAAILCENEDKLRDAANHLSNAMRIALKVGTMHQEAAECCKRQIQLWKEIDSLPNIVRAYLVFVIIQLVMNDYVAADLSYKEALQMPRFCESDEAEAIEKLLAVFDDGDDEALKAVISHPLIRHQDVEVSKLAKELKLPGTRNTKKSDVRDLQGTGLDDELEAEYGNKVEDEDEFSGGLT